ncbi:hypothetical protein [Arthrobacter sp. lap29]|uniref:hypothetical protein n=1 Tax=Arthrobacter sp. lap29 TaxID=3056122 RepID=UPI0028F6E3CB|nr:hypothetical protein [Arthrobacter sp. lap29]
MQGQNSTGRLLASAFLSLTVLVELAKESWLWRRSVSAAVVALGTGQRSGFDPGLEPLTPVLAESALN